MTRRRPTRRPWQVAKLTLLLVASSVACHDAATAPMPIKPLSVLLGASFTLVTVDGAPLPSPADFPSATTTGEVLVPFLVHAGTLHFSATGEHAEMSVGPLDPLVAGQTPSWYSGSHDVSFVGSDSMTFDGKDLGVLIVGPSAAGKYRADTLRLATLMVTYTYPPIIPEPHLPPHFPPYGIHRWTFVRTTS